MVSQTVTDPIADTQASGLEDDRDAGSAPPPTRGRHGGHGPSKPVGQTRRSSRKK
jgi:hypothetical protein